MDSRPTYEITGVLDLPDNLGSGTRNPYSTRTFSKMLTESCQTWLLVVPLTAQESQSRLEEYISSPLPGSWQKESLNLDF